MRTLVAVATSLAALALAPVARAQQAPAALAPLASTPAPIDAQQVPVPGTAVRAGRVSTVVDAPFDAVASVALDFAHYRDFLPQVRQSRVVRRRRGGADVYLQVPLLENLGVLWALVRFDVTRGPGSLVVTGAEQQGNVARLDFRLELAAVPGARQTRVVMQLLAVPDLPFPTSLVSGQQPRWAGRGLAAMRDRAEQRARATGGGPVR